MKLFAPIYLDEDVSILVAVLLRAKGFDAITARDEKMLTKPDPAQLSHAVSLEHCLLTHNRLDYEHLHQIYIAQNMPHFGIVISSQRTPYEIAQRLAVLLNGLTADEFENQLLYI